MKMDDLGVKPHYFRKHPYFTSTSSLKIFTGWKKSHPPTPSVSLTGDQRGQALRNVRDDAPLGALVRNPWMSPGRKLGSSVGYNPA